MKTLFPFICNYYFPGLGQLILKKYWNGILMLTTWVIALLFSNQLFENGYVLPVVVHFAFVIWALFDLFDYVEKLEGRKSAVRKLFFSAIITLIIIPLVLNLAFVGMLQGGKFFVDEYLNEERTKEEMETISIDLDRYEEHYGQYPKDFDSFIRNKPIRSGWRTDAWQNKYSYSSEDSSYTLISAGKDEKLGTEDDIIVLN